jgi:hypothetical protein
VESIGAQAFEGCAVLTSITIPGGVSEIGHSTFRDCTALTSITLEDGITCIPSYMFYGCWARPIVFLPDSVTNVEISAFYNMLGATPYGGEDAAAFYKRMADKSSLPLYRDMYLASLLLDRDLTTFVSQIAGEQSVLSLGDVPTHYQEALMIYNEQHPFTPIDFVSDDVVSQRYHDYITLREAHASDLVVMENLCKRHFGDTYWYYYDFVK